MITLKEQFKHHIKKSEITKIELSDYVYWELSGRDGDYSTEYKYCPIDSKEFKEWSKLLDQICLVEHYFLNAYNKTNYEIEFFNSFSYDKFKKEIALFKLQNS